MNKVRSMSGGDAGGKQWIPGVSPALGHKDKAGFEKIHAGRVTLRFGSV